MGRVDHLIVGAGLTGATIARTLADAGRDVLVLERRGHVGGNCHDYVHESGVRVNSHGPHYFRTNSERVWRWVQRFGKWRPWRAKVLTRDGDRLIDWPPLDWGVTERGHCTGDPANFADACLRRMSVERFRTLVRGYTEKQWGVSAETLERGLAARIETGDGWFSRHRFQALPVDGYTALIERMLEGVEVRTGHDVTPASLPAFRRLVWTGPVDAYFSFDLGRLRYRGQRRRTRWEQSDGLVGGFWQPAVQVNEPDPAVSIIRTIEWKHQMPPEDRAGVRGTVITTETPRDATEPDECEYPFPDGPNQELTQRYLGRRPDNVTFAGRLGLGRYLDMDQAIAAALAVAEKLLVGG